MTQCEWCKNKENVEKLKKMCEKSDDRWRELTQIAEFVEKHAEFSAFSGTSILPLIREQDPNICQKVISQIENARKRKTDELRHRTKDVP